jgi:predicted DNA-binding protein YlxM (UPF0122 family)
MMMDKVYEITLLYDFYGELLTQKQKSVMELYYLNDLSLYEIAEQYSITRQAVLDMLKRTEKLLRQYESKLHLIQVYLQRKKKLEEIDEQFEELAERLIENPQVGVLEKNGIRNLRKTVSEILD